ncbi:YqhR family membrane protein [Salipaludibacillus aurantiacus]|uniref:Conserved membrane protein YqhR n=1 Tax=Salipaludibacillus aurantiacus TaxID=1601833 RepID=A0A1H9PNQ4_9BACI|nr:YqhR family membrane protein [Salipaludibacillus aurantiacus]SER49455.1 Conserved membrane protein YqhR [Salipaludibacillus aurantiacus]
MEKKTDNHLNENPSFNSSVAVTGFAGGIIWSVIGYIAYFFNFISFGPAIVLMPWALGEWKTGPLGQWIGVVIIGVLSIGLAFLYRLLFAKINKFWPGLLFGGALWLLVFFIMNPLFKGINFIPVLDFNTLVTSFSLYLIYGLFIGYSISFDYYERSRQNEATVQE